MAKPPDHVQTYQPPLAGYYYQLTGAMRGAVTVDPAATHVDVTSAQSTNPWNGNYRLSGVVATAADQPVLRCQVRPSESDPPIEIVLGGHAAPAPTRIVLRDDADAFWAELIREGDRLRFVDIDGKTRVEITLGSGGVPAVAVHVLDPDGAPVTRGALLMP